MSVAWGVSWLTRDIVLPRAISMVSIVIDSVSLILGEAKFRNVMVISS